MTKRHLVSYLLPLGLVLSFAGILLAQNANKTQGTQNAGNAQDTENPDNAQNMPDTQDAQSPQDAQNPQETQNPQNPSSRPFIVNGTQVGTVVQMDGRSYVDVETLAQATNGSVTIEPNRVVLNLPATQAGGQTGTGGNQSPEPEQQQGLSRGFAREAIGVLAEMREWRGAIGTILMYNTYVVGTWPQDYRARVRLSIDRLSVSAMTADDSNALALIQNEFSNLSDWADSVVATRQSLNATNTVRPSALEDDPQLAQITVCSRFLSFMLVSGQFSDDPSCH
jgi:hypothetical protein